MQPEVAGLEAMIRPPRRTARIEAAPEVQAPCVPFAPVACAAGSPSRAASASARQRQRRSVGRSAPTGLGKTRKDRWLRAGGRFSCARSGNKKIVPRALWSGTISFGLVNVPVRMASAIAEHKLHFHWVHEKDESPIGYQKICKLEDEPVPDEEVVKAFEFEPGEYVFMADEDFEAARVEGYKTIEITDFVPYEQIDPIYFAHTYYLGPQAGGEKVYSLLVRAMEEAGLAGIAKFVLRDRQHLGALRVRDGVLALEQLYFADEIRPVDELKPAATRVSKEELAMAEQLINNFSGDFEPGKYKDTYRDALCQVIRAKRAGKQVHHAAEPEEAPPPDLLEALRASIEAAGRDGRRHPRRASRNGADRELARLTRSELEERARRAKIRGRSKMSKSELIEALSEAA